ncbi:MAG: hypothetical protein VB106_14260, partial [Clostridiaceae bacterium]|nr:hypothetical protein [Clostridiaceae bacterium]
GKEALFTYGKIPRSKATSILDELHDLEFAIRTETYGKDHSLYITQYMNGVDIFFPKDLVTHSSQPMSTIARLPTLAAKFLLQAYVTHDQQLNLCCDMTRFPFEKFDSENIFEDHTYNLLRTSTSTLFWGKTLNERVNTAWARALKILLEKRLLHRSIAVLDTTSEDLPTLLYNLTPPYPHMDKESVSLGTRIKKFCRELGYEIKEGRWVAFFPRDEQITVVAVYSPYFYFQWSDYKQGLQEYAERQAEAENTWSEIKQFLEEYICFDEDTKN